MSRHVYEWTTTEVHECRYRVVAHSLEEATELFEEYSETVELIGTNVTERQWLGSKPRMVGRASDGSDVRA